MAGSFEGLRSLSDIDLFTAANDPRPSASFSARKNPPCIPRIHLRFFDPAASHLAAPPSPRHEGNVGQAPGQSGWSPRSSGELRSGLCHRAKKILSIWNNKKGTGRFQAWPLTPCSVFFYVTAQRDGDRCVVGGECIGQTPGRLNSRDFRKWLRPYSRNISHKDS